MQRQHIFIVGCARTGTTLLRQILSKSDRVAIAFETHYLHRFSTHGGGRKKAFGDLTRNENLDKMIDFMYPAEIALVPRIGVGCSAVSIAVIFKD